MSFCKRILDESFSEKGLYNRALIMKKRAGFLNRPVCLL
jgi:hypothetical protein